MNSLCLFVFQGFPLFVNSVAWLEGMRWLVNSIGQFNSLSFQPRSQGVLSFNWVELNLFLKNRSLYLRLLTSKTTLAEANLVPKASFLRQYWPSYPARSNSQFDWLFDNKRLTNYSKELLLGFGEKLVNFGSLSRENRAKDWKKDCWYTQMRCLCPSWWGLSPIRLRMWEKLAIFGHVGEHSYWFPIKNGPISNEFVFSFSQYITLHRWKKVVHFSSHFHTSSNFCGLIT